MATVALTADARPISLSEWALKSAAGFWWLAAILGQWIFLAYIVAFYGTTTLTADFQAWSKNTFLLKGYVPGDTAGNLAFAAHALLAAVTSFGGGLQLVPWIRRYAPKLHRWNGRAFLVTAIGVSLTGLYMVWVRGATVDFVNSVGITINAALILIFAALAWRSALRRDFDAHRRWALRTFLVANAQWFLRVGVFGSFIVARGAFGLGKEIGEPLFHFWAFGCYLMPLAVLEIYLRAKESGSTRFRLATSASLVALTLFMSLGVFAISAVMWLPLMAKL